MVVQLKNVKKTITSLFIVFFFFSFFSQNAISTTTIEDTTFPADVGKSYKWKITYPDDVKGQAMTYTIESIDQGVHNSIDALMVNCTFTGYHPSVGSVVLENNTLYMAANNTQNYLAFETYWWGPLIIPTPINLTLVAEAINANNYSIVDNTIIENKGDGDSEEYTFNTKGFLTKGIIKIDGVLFTKYVLDTGGDAAIPFGNFFLIFTVTSVIALIYLKKQKIN